jgi:3-(3-hydroxy-phenyl)propionate hydroxylase
MPPFAGQGMCAGIRDVHNLAWKLDLVLRGIVAPALLQTYESERLPQVTATIQRVMRAGQIIQTRRPLLAHLRNLFFRAVKFLPRYNAG